VAPDVSYCLSAHHGRLDREETRIVTNREVADPLTVKEQGTYTQEGSNNFRLRNVQAVFRKVHRAASKDDAETWAEAEQANTLNQFDSGSRDTHAIVSPAVESCAGVRRLTPLECERLQGFPEGWTDVPYRGKPAKDAPRYRALGNAFPVPVVRWIGERIHALR